jgi:hypothetical protein
MRLAPLFLLLVFWLPTHAQEKPQLPDAPKPKTDRIFWIGTAALAAAKTFDAAETRSLLDRGGAEGNVLYGRFPSPVKQGLINAAIFAGEVTLFHFTERSKHNWIRWAGRAYITFTVGDHFRAGACNAGLNTHSPTAQGCTPF